MPDDLGDLAVLGMFEVAAPHPVIESAHRRAAPHAVELTPGVLHPGFIAEKNRNNGIRIRRV